MSDKPTPTEPQPTPQPTSPPAGVEPTPTAPPPAPPTPPAPPWGSADKFDPDRAWKLITDLREDITKVKADRETWKSKATKYETDQLTDSQRLERERDEARQERDSNGVELARLKAAVKHGISEEDLDLLGSGTAEEIEDRAKRLADRLGKPTPQVDPGRKPKERLRGGSEPEEEPEETDPAKLAAKVRRGF